MTLSTDIKIERFREWEGTAEDLATEAGRVLAAVFPQSEPPSLRLVRHYAQLGIVGDADRPGRRFGFHHLLQLVAASVLVRQDWPLKKIAEYLPSLGDNDLLNLIPSVPKASSRDVARGLLRESGLEPTPRAGSADPLASSDFVQHAARMSGLQADLGQAMQRLTGRNDGPRAEQVTLIAVTTWCQVLVESSKLRKLTVDEAEAVGRLVTAALLNPNIRKGG
jgi:hypothetical protein